MIRYLKVIILNYLYTHHKVIILNTLISLLLLFLLLSYKDYYYCKSLHTYLYY